MASPWNKLSPCNSQHIVNYPWLIFFFKFLHCFSQWSGKAFLSLFERIYALRNQRNEEVKGSFGLFIKEKGRIQNSIVWSVTEIRGLVPHPLIMSVSMIFAQGENVSNLKKNTKQTQQKDKMLRMTWNNQSENVANPHEDTQDQNQKPVCTAGQVSQTEAGFSSLQWGARLPSRCVSPGWRAAHPSPPRLAPALGMQCRTAPGPPAIAPAVLPSLPPDQYGPGRPLPAARCPAPFSSPARHSKRCWLRTLHPVFGKDTNRQWGANWNRLQAKRGQFRTNLGRFIQGNWFRKSHKLGWVAYFFYSVRIVNSGIVWIVLFALMFWHRHRYTSIWDS